MVVSSTLGQTSSSLELRWLAPTWLLNVCRQHRVILADLIECQDIDRDAPLLSLAAPSKTLHDFLDRFDSVGGEVGAPRGNHKKTFRAFMPGHVVQEAENRLRNRVIVDGRFDLHNPGRRLPTNRGPHDQVGSKLSHQFCGFCSLLRLAAKG